MNPTLIIEDNPLKAWKQTLETHSNGSPLFITTNLNNLDIDCSLFKKYFDSFKWHFRDSTRSLNTKMTRNLTQYEFSYYDRIHNYFGMDQDDVVLNNHGNIICTWDSRSDYKNQPRPCLTTIKLIPDKNELNLSITFRNRDTIRRMYPNFVALLSFQQKYAQKLNMKIGRLFDYSNQASCKKEDLAKVKSWEEYKEY